MKKIILFFTILIGILFDTNYALLAKNKKIDEDYFTTLKNGMKVLILKRDFGNIMSHSVYYDVGGLDDFYGKAGLAHFLEHLMFKSTSNHKSGELVKFFDDNGMQYNAMTGYEFTAYYEIGRKELLEDSMRFESDRMVNLVLKDDEIDAERKVVKEERRMRVDDNLSERFYEKLSGVFYDNNFYGQSLIGTINDLNATQNQDFRDFYKKYYNPKNALLVIVGDVNIDDTMSLVEKYYGILNNRDSEVVNYYRDRDFKNDSVKGGYDMSYSSKDNKSPNYTYLTFALTFSESFDDGVEADFASYFLVNGDGMLKEKLVDSMKIASSVGVQYDPFSKKGTPFLINIGVIDNGKLNAIYDFMDDFIKNIDKLEIKNNDIERMKNLFISSKVFRDDDIEFLSMFYARGLLSGLKISDIKDYEGHVKKIGDYDVRKMIKKIFGNTYITGFMYGW